jgi:hypothetical protein
MDIKLALNPRDFRKFISSYRIYLSQFFFTNSLPALKFVACCQENKNKTQVDTPNPTKN